MPLTVEQYEQSLSAPPLCEQLRIRDLLDNVAVQIDGSMVAGYEVGGIQSYYASDEGRNRLKGLLEALVRSLPERSMRMQVRFEISEGTGDLISRYVRERRSESQVLRELDRLHIELWRSREDPPAFICSTFSTCISSGTRGFTTSHRTSSGNGTMKSSGQLESLGCEMHRTLAAGTRGACSPNSTACWLGWKRRSGRRVCRFAG